MPNIIARLGLGEEAGAEEIGNRLCGAMQCNACPLYDMCRRRNGWKWLLIAFAAREVERAQRYAWQSICPHCQYHRTKMLAASLSHSGGDKPGCAHPQSEPPYEIAFEKCRLLRKDGE
jgi:hypothetical protein